MAVCWSVLGSSGPSIYLLALGIQTHQQEMTRKLDFSSLALSSQWTCFHFHFSASKWLFLAKLLVTVFVQTKICYSSLLDKKENKFFLTTKFDKWDFLYGSENNFAISSSASQVKSPFAKLILYHLLAFWTLCDHFLSIRAPKLTGLDFHPYKEQDVCCISLLIDG